MNNEVLKDVEVFDYHGWREQCKHIMSEVYELTEAVHDYETSSASPTLGNICEEIADIEFMLNQFKENYLIEPKNIEAWKEFKRKRETKRLKEGYYGKKFGE